MSAGTAPEAVRLRLKLAVPPTLVTADDKLKLLALALDILMSHKTIANDTTNLNRYICFPNGPKIRHNFGCTVATLKARASNLRRAGILIATQESACPQDGTTCLLESVWLLLWVQA